MKRMCKFYRKINKNFYCIAQQNTPKCNCCGDKRNCELYKFDKSKNDKNYRSKWGVFA